MLRRLHRIVLAQLAFDIGADFDKFLGHLIHHLPLLLHVFHAALGRYLEHVQGFDELLDVRGQPFVDLDVRDDFAEAFVYLILGLVDVAQLVDVVTVFGKDLGVEAEIQVIAPEYFI